MNSLIALLVAQPYIVGIVACAIIAGVVAIIRACKAEAAPTSKRASAWAQALVCVILAAVTEYARSQQAGVAFNLASAIQWATANIGTSLVAYRMGKKAWAQLKMWFGK